MAFLSVFHDFLPARDSIRPGEVSPVTNAVAVLDRLIVEAGDIIVELIAATHHMVI